MFKRLKEIIKQADGDREFAQELLKREVTAWFESASNIQTLHKHKSVYFFMRIVNNIEIFTLFMKFAFKSLVAKKPVGYAFRSYLHPAGQNQWSLGVDVATKWEQYTTNNYLQGVVTGNATNSTKAVINFRDKPVE